MGDERKCSTCQVVQPEGEFYKRKDGRFVYECKSCVKARSRKNYWKDPDKARNQCKKWQLENKEYKKAYDREYRNANIEHKRNLDRIYYRNHKEKWKRWAELNKEERRVRHAHRCRKYRESLTDDCVRAVMGVTKEQATPEIIAAKREQLLLHRAIKHLKKEIKNGKGK